MGACMSAGAPAELIQKTNGSEEAYRKRFKEDKVLGEGEFGKVTLVHDKSNPSAEPMASKLLRKGAIFKDNTLYSAIDPKVLQAEIEILRTLGGKRYCMKLEAVYETRSVLYMITELCAGGEMMEYVAAQSDDLRTEDVSRIAFQLLSAVDHCAKHGIIHRDIKPENCMFQTYAPQSELRLIDFGSGTINLDSTSVQHKADDLDVHTTFAGSAFYISPEVFQHTYTYKTDVWSAGATIYVLVAGYPGDDLQKAFNLLQKSKRDLRSLPNMPENMPDSYYELLDKLLVYQSKKRPSAGELLDSEFAQFHAEHSKSPTGSVTTKTGGKMRRTASVSFLGSVSRHTVTLGFKKYERSLTTLLATVLSKMELAQMLAILKERRGKAKPTSVAEAAMLAAQEYDNDDDDNEDAYNINLDNPSHDRKLNVISVGELQSILQNDLKNDQIVHMIEKLPQHALYSNYAYHVALLKDFSEVSAEDVGRNTAGSGRRASTAVLSSKANASNSSGGESTLSTSTHSSSRNLSDKKQRPAQQRSHSVFM